jgi:hypothetical protein
MCWSPLLQSPLADLVTKGNMGAPVDQEAAVKLKEHLSLQRTRRKAENDHAFVFCCPSGPKRFS